MMKPENAPEQSIAQPITTERVLSTMDAELTRALLHKAGIMLVPQRMRDVAAVVAEAATQMQREAIAPMAKQLFDTERVLNEAALALGFEQGRTLADVPAVMKARISELEEKFTVACAQRDELQMRIDSADATISGLRARDEHPNA